MSAIKGVIKEEHQRLLQLRNKYERELKILPRGAVSNKKRGSNSYMYMALRKGNKIVFNYIGSITSDKAVKIMKQVIIRDKYREKLKKVRQNLIEVGRMIRKRKARIIS